jgi:predicted DnaQ family exonuclease/DinG family helicase
MTEAGSASYPRTFVGLDLETTGIDSKTDRIIEVGAVRIVDGKIEETFEALVNPGCPIPSDIVHLTGISDADVAGAPTIDEVLPRIVEFIGGSPIVAHHAPFDTGFLNEAAAGHPELLVGRGGVFDTLPLTRALLPRLPNHRLVTAASFFDIPTGRSHRATDDARAVADLFLSLLGVLDQIGASVLERMYRLADKATRTLIEAARERAESKIDPLAVPDHGEKESELQRLDTVRGLGAPRVPAEEISEIDLDELESLFSTDGPIGRELRGYEIRRQQLQMLRAVGDSLMGGVHLVVEAGTGVGKSLAYLTPAVYFAVQNGERVIVSTNTKNLQEQLFLKDVPFLERVLDINFSVSLLKGRGNYICQSRWRQVLEKGLSPSERSQLLPVVLWEQETRSGDISENVAFRQRGYLWSRISAEGGPCLGQKCPMRDTCYLLKARKASQAAHLVIVNHSLLFSDTEADNRILGEYSYLICDEAHNMEQVATEHLGKRSNIWRARAMLDNLFRNEGGASGDLGEIIGALSGGDGALLESAAVGAERLSSDVAVASAASETFFAALAERHKDLNDGREVEFGKLRYRQEAPVAALLESELAVILAALSKVAKGAATLADLITDSELERADAFVQNLTFHAARIREFASDLEYVAEAADPESVFWLDVNTFRDVFECELRSAPVSVAEMMGDFLYSRVDSLIATSATMTVDGSFDFVMERLGLDLIPDWKVLTLDVGSPYDYDAQSIAVVAGYLPQPSSPGFNQTVARLVVKLSERALGGTLVLFTARSALDAVFKAVVDPLTARGKLVLAQGHGGAASSLLEQFAREVDSVLLATSSFWEGVDVPGRSLEQLVIVKLPFPVPRDPVVEAHCERYEADGENSFGRYMIPRTAIRLRQGFGRLIRSTTDSGAVIFLDSRLSTRAYGDRLLEQLPTRTIIVDSEQGLLTALAGIHADQSAV